MLEKETLPQFVSPTMKQPISIEDVYPDLPPEKQVEAEQALLEYLDLVGEIYEDLRADPEKYKEFKRLLQEHRQTDDS